MVVTLAIIGAGQRGKVYASYATSHPDLCKVVAVAEPRPKTRNIMAAAHSVPEPMVFTSWQDLFAASEEHFKRTGKGLADAVVVAVLDRMHAEVVLAFVKHGYNILCEKPLATTPEECIQMVDAIRDSGKIFAIGHVLRYSPYNQAISEIIRSRVLGDIVNIVHVEPVGYFHFAHSYVRGNWAKEADSSFSLMTKSCHDIDILCHYLGPSTPVRVSSFGSLSHFKKSQKPKSAGSATKCLECPSKDECAYSAKKIYLDPVTNGHRAWPVNTLTDGVPDIESVYTALSNGPYGACVYESSNDVVDNQVVNLEFSDGQTCSFTMIAFTEAICERQTRIHFTHGELVGDMTTFTTVDFERGVVEGKKVHVPGVDARSGHGGGDSALAAAFVKAVGEGRQDVLGVTPEDVLKSHLAVFAAEYSRKEGKVVDVEEYTKQVRAKMVV